MKYSKDMTTKLIKYVTKCEIRYNPFDVRSTPAKEVLRQMRSPRLMKSNSKFAAVADVLTTVKAPVVDFTFVDESKKTFNVTTPKLYAKDIIEEMWEHAKEIDFEYQINDKEIDV